MEFFATCPLGLEMSLAEELRSIIKARPRPLKGRVSFEADINEALRVVLLSSCASRIMLVCGRGQAKNSDELFHTLHSISWEDYLLSDRSFSVDASGTNKELRSTSFISLRAKDAIVERMGKQMGVRPRFTPREADTSLFVHLSGERVSAGVVLSGEAPLFARGVRLGLRSDYAATLLQGAHTGASALLFAGDSNLLREVNAIADNQTHELKRRLSVIPPCRLFDHKLLDEVFAGAQEQLAQTSGEQHTMLIEPREKNYERAFKELRASGKEPKSLLFRSADELGTTIDTLMCDLSWTRAEVPLFAEAFSELLRTARAVRAEHIRLLSPFDTRELLDVPQSSTELLMGKHQLYLAKLDDVQTTLEALPQVELGSQDIMCLDTGAPQFANRLAKVFKQKGRTATRENIDAWRVYDADLADFSFAIELYKEESSARKIALISEYAPPRSVDTAKALRRRIDACTITGALLLSRHDELIFKTRQNSKGGSQYSSDAREYKISERFVLQEGGLSFELNFHARHDVGIFLDMRDVRGLVREKVKNYGRGARFLNLFCYTTSASVYAADGGARTTNIDLSKTSLEIGRRNFDLNGFNASEHEFVQADVLKWAGEARHSDTRWDLVFCDVPSFSNSSRMRRRGFDVQRDHVELIIAISRLLTKDGEAIFSCNLRRFKPDVLALQKAGVILEDISAKTVPYDFERTPNIHHCYLVKREL